MRVICFLLFIIYHNALWSKPLVQKGPLDFIKEFYKGYLNSKNVDAFLLNNPFFSNSLENLLKKNHDLCSLRSQEICGYDADGDIFLQTQETGPDLSFKNSQFQAKESSPAVIDVQFNVYPSYSDPSAPNPDFYLKKIRFLMVKEGASWRVDNLIPAYNGAYSEDNSMRARIQSEIKGVLEQARDLKSVISDLELPIHLNLSSNNFENFYFYSDYPLDFCDKAGVCEKITTVHPKRRDYFEQLKTLVKAKKEKSLINDEVFFNSLSVKNAKNGDLVKRGYYTFILRDSMWWLKAIHLKDI